MHLYNFIFGLSTFSVACQSQVEESPCRTYVSDFVATTTMSAEIAGSATIAWGGVVMFRMTDAQTPNEKRVALSLTDREGVVKRIPAQAPHPVCTLRMTKCVWVIPTAGWTTKEGYVLTCANSKTPKTSSLC